MAYKDFDDYNAKVCADQQHIAGTAKTVPVQKEPNMIDKLRAKELKLIEELQKVQGAIGFLNRHPEAEQYVDQMRWI